MFQSLLSGLSPRWRRTPRLAVMFAGLAMLLLTSACEGPQEREAAYMKRGKALLEKSKLIKASLEFRNALQVNSTNLEARYFLGVIFERQGKWRQAFSTFNAVIVEKPLHPGANLHLARFYLLAGDTDEAEKKIAVTLKQKPNDAEARALRAAVYLRRNKLQAAIDEAEAARKTDANNLAAMSVIVQAYRKMKEPDKALEILNEAVDKNPTKTAPLILRISLHLEQNKRDLVERDFSRLFEIAPKEPAFRLALARVYIIWNRSAAAEIALRDAVRVAPKNDTLKQLLVVFLRKRRKFGVAEKSLNQLIVKNPSSQIYRFGLADLYARNDLASKAKSIYTAIIQSKKEKKNPQAIAARAAFARLLLIEGKTAAARKEIEEVMKLDPANEAGILMLAQMNFRIKKYDSVISELRQLIGNKPNAINAGRLLAEAYIRKRQFDLAGDTLAKLVKQRPRDDKIAVRLAQLYALQKRYPAANGVLDKVIARSPGLESALATKAEIQAREKRYEPASETLRKLLKITKNKALVYRLLGRVYLRNRNYQKALWALESAVELKSFDGELATMITTSYVALGKLSKAETRIRTFQKEKPKEAYLPNLLGEVYARQRRYKLAHQAFEKASRINPKWIVPYLNRSNLYVAKNDVPAAISILNTGLEKTPGNNGLLFALGLVYQRAGKIDQAIAAYDKIIAGGSKAPAVANNLAMLLAEYRSTDKKALDRAFELVRGFDSSQNPSFLDTLGWLHYRRGEYKKAILRLRRSASMVPGNAEFRYHLGMAYFRDGQLKLAKTELTNAIAKGAKYRGVEEAKTTLSRLTVEE